MPAGSEEMIALLRKLRQGSKALPQPRVDITPGCAFGAVVDQRLKDLEQHIEELKARVNGLIYLVIGAVIVQVIMRLI